MLLYERDNDINDAGFPRSDGRLVVWACSAAARSRLALKRSSLSFEHSLDTLTAARLRWAARRSSLCSLSSLDRLTKFPATFARCLHKNAQNRPIPDEDNTHNLQTLPGQTKSDLERSALARHGPPHQSLPDITGQTKSGLECSALRAEYFPSNEGEKHYHCEGTIKQTANNIALISNKPLAVGAVLLLICWKSLFQLNKHRGATSNAELNVFVHLDIANLSKRWNRIYFR